MRSARTFGNGAASLCTHWNVGSAGAAGCFAKSLADGVSSCGGLSAFFELPLLLRGV